MHICFVDHVLVVDVCWCVQLVTTAIPDALVRRREGVPIWVIIVAVIAGVILLSLLIICLWKVCAWPLHIFYLLAVLQMSADVYYYFLCHSNSRTCHVLLVIK